MTFYLAGSNQSWHHVHRQLNLGLLAGIITTYPFSIPLCNFILLATCGHWLIWIIHTGRNFRLANPKVWIMIIPYLLGVVSLYYSEHLDIGIYELEKKIGLLIMPLVLGTIPQLSAREFNRLNIVATASGIVALLYCTIIAATTASSDDGFFWKELTHPINFNPTYFALYLNFLTAWLGFFLIRSWTDLTLSKRVVMTFGLGFFYVCIVLLASKLHVIIGVMIFMLQMHLLVRHVKAVIIVPLVIALLSALIWFGRDSYMWERFKHIDRLTYKIDGPVSSFNEFTIRLAIIECSADVIKNNLIIGVGIGDVYAELEKAYYKFDYKFGYLDKQNPHNEYLSQFLATGLIGLTAFLVTLFLPLTISILRRDSVFTILMLLFMVSFAFESVLERQKGIVLFSIFVSLYLFHGNNKKPDPV